MYKKDKIEIVDIPGYFGKHRRDKEQEYNEKYGVGNWEECWRFREDILTFDEAVSLYDLSYYNYLKENIEIAKMFAREYSDCYDNDISNTSSGFNHDNKAIPRHIQDVSIRRAFRELRISWNKVDSKPLLQARSVDSNGYILSPMIVSFVYPDAIIRSVETYDVAKIKQSNLAGPVKSWVRKNSVEEFWQANKVIIIKKS